MQHLYERGCGLENQSGRFDNNLSTFNNFQSAISFMPKKSVFRNKRLKAKFTAKKIGENGFYEASTIASTRVYFRKKLPPINKWRLVRTNAGATFFELPNGKKVVVKPDDKEPYPFSKVGVKNGQRSLIIVLEKVLRKKIRFEVPLGRIKTSEGNFYFVSQVVKGVQLNKWLANANTIDAIKVARNMGEYLADMHNKGVVHLEASAPNWIIDGLKPTLVDAKYLAFKEEYDSHGQSGKKHAWEDELVKNVRSSAVWLPKVTQQIFLNAYNEKRK